MRKTPPVFTLRNGAPTTVPIADIVVGPRLRALDPAVVATLAKSIDAIGLKTPITVRRDGTVYVLVVGFHRLEAVRALGRQEILAVIMLGNDEREAKLWEISENLDRCELAALEPADHIRETVRPTEQNLHQIGPLPPARLPQSALRT